MRWTRIAPLVLALVVTAAPALADEVRVKDLGRFLGWRQNALVGYGVVIGLAGSGDSPRNTITRNSLRNVLSRLGVNLAPEDIQSRNVAAVVVTAELPAAANVGDQINVTVSSIGDARSLVGGTLLMTSLIGADQRTYALAQGSLVVGGYRFDAQLNREQKNYPAAGVIPGGATVEAAVKPDLVGPDQTLTFVLADPDAMTAERIADAINAGVGPARARVRDSGAVVIGVGAGDDVYRLIAIVDDVLVTPDPLARVVINERSGTIVAGGGVRLSSVVVSQGDIRVSVSTDDDYGFGGTYGYGAVGLDRRGLVVANTRLDVGAEDRDAVATFPDTTVADLVAGLARVHVDTRGVIAVLQAVKAAGALHADIVVQ